MQEERRLSAKLLIPLKMKITDGRKLVTFATAAEAVLLLLLLLLLLLELELVTNI